MAFPADMVTNRLPTAKPKRGMRSLLVYLPYALPLALLLLLAAAVRAHGRIPYPNALYAAWDHFRYMAMATHPFGTDPLAHDPPFCWRVLTPWLVHLLPVVHTTGFWLVTVTSLLAATVSLMWFLRALGLPRVAAVAGGLAFVLLGPGVPFVLWDYMLVDPLAFALLATCLGCVVTRKGPLVLLLLVVYGFEKETVLLAAAFALVYAYEQRDWKLLRWSFAGIVVAGAIQLGLHVLIPAYRPYSLIHEFETVRTMYEQNASEIWLRLVDTFAGTWGILLPVAALQLVHRPRVLLRPSFLVLGVAATAQVLVSINSGRVVVYAFPVVIASCAFEIEYLVRATRLPRWLFWGPVLVLEVPLMLVNSQLETWSKRYEATIGSIDPQPLEAALFIAAVAIALWAAYAFLRRRGATPVSAPVEGPAPVRAEVR